MISGNNEVSLVAKHIVRDLLLHDTNYAFLLEIYPQYVQQCLTALIRAPKAVDLLSIDGIEFSQMAWNL